MAIREVTILEAKARLSELLVDVEQGEQVTVTRRGIAVARLVPVAATQRTLASQRQRVAATFELLRAQREGVSLDATLAEDIAEGRD